MKIRSVIAYGLAMVACTMVSGCAYWPFSTIHRWWVESQPQVSVYKPELPSDNAKKLKDGPVQKSDARSIDNLQRLAKAGNPNAQVALGKFYFDGAGEVKKDPQKAFELFLAAAESQNPQGMYNVAICYDGGIGVKQDAQKALDWYSRAAEAQIPEAMAKVTSVAEEKGDFLLALKYLRILGANGNPTCLRKAALLLINGFGELKTPTEPFDLLLQAAQLGDVRAQLHLADCYQRGRFTTVDYDEMFSWLTIAAQTGDPEAQCKLAYCYAKGMGTTPNADIAFSWYSQAAKASYPAAVASLADCYLEGRGVRRNLRQAVQLYQQAATAKDYVAQYRLAQLHLNGIGVDKSPERAVSYLQASAQQNFPPALVTLGRLYEEGTHLAKNTTAAFTCYLKAAEQNDPAAMECLGRCFFMGIGTSPDRVMAKKWLEAAAVRGNTNAKMLAQKLGLDVATP